MSDTTASLRRKIGGAGDLQAVVRTMKAVAASSIGQYENSVHALGHYFRAVELALGAYFRNDLPAAEIGESGRRMPMKIRAVVFGSDQGLVGQFNDTVADFAVQSLSQLPGSGLSPPPVVWAVGERVHSRLVDAGLSVRGCLAVPASVKAITPLIGQILFESENSHRTEEPITLLLYHNRPLPGAGYAPVAQRLLPLDEIWRRELRDLPWPTRNLPEVLGDRTATLQALVREYLFVSLYQACAESLASENASRLAAMQRAEKNISELLDDLNGKFHRLRQYGIDEELFDVISGFEALNGHQS